MNLQVNTIKSALRRFSICRSCLLKRQTVLNGPVLRRLIQKNTFTSVACRRQLQQGSTTRKPAYPVRLLIYSAGDNKTAFIGFWKATSIALFGISCGLLAPRFYYSEENEYQRYLKVAGVVVLGAIPMMIVGYVTAPFVNSVNLHLPEYARRSKHVLMKYAEKLPRDAELEFITMRLLPFPKTTGVRLYELKTLPPRWLRLANFERIDSPRVQRELKGRPWYKKVLGVLAEQRYKFYIKEDPRATRRSRAPGVWEAVVKEIRNKRQA